MKIKNINLFKNEKARWAFEGVLFLGMFTFGIWLGFVLLS